MVVIFTYMKYIIIIFIISIFIPNTVFASPPSNSLIKGKSSKSVYYLGQDGKRYVFPNEKIFYSWYKNFGDVIEISDIDLSMYQLGGNITYKPATRLVKITTDPKVYAIDAGGVLRWIESEDTARELYGNDWANKVDDIPDTFFTDYKIGNNIIQSADFDKIAINTIPTIYENKETYLNSYKYDGEKANMPPITEYSTSGNQYKIIYKFYKDDNACKIDINLSANNTKYTLEITSDKEVRTYNFDKAYINNIYSFHKIIELDYSLLRDKVVKVYIKELNITNIINLQSGLIE